MKYQKHKLIVMRYAINYALQVRVIEIFLHWNRVILKQKFNTLIKVDIKQKLLPSQSKTIEFFAGFKVSHA